MAPELDLFFDQLPPVRTVPAPAAVISAATTRTDADESTVEDDGCVTPTSAANVLPPPSVCPPAPRKPRPRANRKNSCGRRRYSGPASLTAKAWWIIAVPHDLAAIFVARRPASTGASPCRRPAGKKIRVHVVG